MPPEKNKVTLKIGTLRSALYALTFALGFSGPMRAEVPQITLQRDIVFQTIDGVELKLDLAIPQGPGPFPLILCIHGGAWHVGDKSNDLGEAGVRCQAEPRCAFC